MNSLQAELRTPPLPLVAFIGCSEVHKEVGSYFNDTLCPPFFSVGLAEPNEQLLTRLFGPPKQQKPITPTPEGILKANWFQKQRQRRAAVAVAFVTRNDVEGDPTSWLRMLSGLRTIRNTSSHKNVQLLVVVVQDGPLTELPQDRLTGLCSNLSVKQRNIRLISRRVADASLPADERRQVQDIELRPLGQLLTEAAAAYYKAAANRLRQRQIDITAALGNCPPEISAVTAFKIAVFAEFRQDWLTAVSYYQAAAAALQGVPLGHPVSCQRHAEVTAVAEVVHFKAMMLLLHQQRYVEAIQQLQGHLAVFGPLPDGLPLSAAAAHHGWLSRQHHTAAEMVAMSHMDQATLQAHRDVTPCYLIMSAVELSATRKALVHQLAETRGGAPAPFDLSSVRKGRFLGQMESKRANDALTKQCDLRDSEFVLYLEAEERRLNHSQLLLDLLQQAQTVLLKQAEQPTAPTTPIASRLGKGAGDRLQARLAWLTAEQHIDAHNLTAARKMLMQTVHIYRRDGWDALLLPSLTLLRDVCQRLKLDKEALLHSLELACLISSSQHSSSSSAAPSADHQKTAGLAAAALAGLLAGPAGKKGGIMKPSAPDRASGDSSDRSSLTAGNDALQLQHQQQLPGYTPDVTSPVKNISSPATESWCYTVRYLDLASALQQLPALDDGVCWSTRVVDALQQYHQQDSGWWRIITILGGFAAHAPDTDQLKVYIALQSHLPVPLPLIKATISLVDGQGSWVQELTVEPERSWLPAAEQHPQHMVPTAANDAGCVHGQSAAQLMHTGGSQGQLLPSSTAKRLSQMHPGSWQVLSADIQPRCVGSVAVGDVLLQLSEHCSVNFLLSSLPPGRSAVGPTGLVSAASPFSVRQAVKQGSWVTKVQHVGALPEVKVLAPQLMLVGEFVPLQVKVQFSAAQGAAYLDLSLQSSTGATPGHVTLLAASPDGKLQSLNSEGHSLPLPAMSTGSCFCQQLWVRSAFAISCKLLVVLSCPAQVRQSVQLQFHEPFEHVTRLSGEVNMHTLVGPSEDFAGERQGTAPAGSSGGVPLVVGQVALAQVLVQAVHDFEMQLLGAQLELPQDVGLQVMNNVADQLVGKTVKMQRGSVHCLLLQLMPLAAVSEPTSIGTLQLRWKRQKPAVLDSDCQEQQASSSSSSNAHGGADGSMLNAAAPSVFVTTSLELPRVVVQESLLSVKVIAPRTAVAGIAFAFSIQVTNMTPQPQDVSISLQEVQGFISAGEKQQNIVLSPRDSGSMSWTLLAHASGQLLLPSIRVSSARFNCHVMTQQGHIHIMPF